MKPPFAPPEPRLLANAAVEKPKKRPRDVVVGYAPEIFFSKHVSLPGDQRQIRLLEIPLERFDHVGADRVYSAIGVPAIYKFFPDMESIPERPDVAPLIKFAKDRTKQSSMPRWTQVIRANCAA